MDPKKKFKYRAKFDYRLKNNKKITTSKLEIKFEKMLKELKIEYVRQYELKGRYYDFMVKCRKKKVLIEVDGDYYHYNKQTQKKDPDKIQKRNMRIDEKKNKLASAFGFLLFRFWENDINKEKDKVKKRLVEIYNEN